jgi:tRNA-splicing ligase RtcB
MRVPGLIFANEALVQGMDEKVLEQICNVARLPGIVDASYAMPDAHWGYGFPIGGVAAFDPDEGVVCAGGVGFDIACGVRALTTRLRADDLMPHQQELGRALFHSIPAGLGSTGAIRLGENDMTAMLAGGAQWAVEQGFGEASDLQWMEEGGHIAGAEPDQVSNHARLRQRAEMGTLGSGNHYLEVQHVVQILEPGAAEVLALTEGGVMISLHCGSRGLGHQVGTEFLREMAIRASQLGLELPDRELASAPIRSTLGQRYLGAIRAASNCALANRQILTHLVRDVFARYFPGERLPLMYDVSHNTCKLETCHLGGEARKLYVHRKGATRAFPPGHATLPGAYRGIGQPLIVGGTMGTASYVMCGARGNEVLAFSSACHGAGRALSRHRARQLYSGHEVQQSLAGRGIAIFSQSNLGIAEEAPEAYKDVEAVVEAAERAGLARRIARLEPLICIKG